MQRECAFFPPFLLCPYLQSADGVYETVFSLGQSSSLFEDPCVTELLTGLASGHPPKPNTPSQRYRLGRVRTIRCSDRVLRRGPPPLRRSRGEWACGVQRAWIELRFEDEGRRTGSRYSGGECGCLFSFYCDSQCPLHPCLGVPVAKSISCICIAAFDECESFTTPFLTSFSSSRFFASCSLPSFGAVKKLTPAHPLGTLLPERRRRPDPRLDYGTRQYPRSERGGRPRHWRDQGRGHQVEHRGTHQSPGMSIPLLP